MNAVQQAVDALASQLDRSVTVDSATGELLAYNLHGHQADAARVEAILARRASPEVIAWERSHETDQPFVTVPGNAELGIGPRLRVSLRSGGAVHGHLSLLAADRPFSAEDVQVVLRCARQLSQLLGAPAGNARPGTAEFDRDLAHALAGWPASEAISLVLEPLSDVESVRVLAALTTTPTRSGPTTLASSRAAAVRQAVSRLPRRALGLHAVAVEDRYVIAVLLGGPTDRCAAAVAEALQQTTSPQRCFVLGISELVPTSTSGLHHAVQQATLTAAVAAADPALPTIVRAECNRLYRRLIPTLAEHDPLAALSAGKPRPQLLETLEAFLDCGGDVARTATRLVVHRATVYNRLERIGALLGVDLADGLVRTDLHLALKQRRLQAAERLFPPG